MLKCQVLFGTPDNKRLPKPKNFLAIWYSVQWEIFRLFHFFKFNALDSGLGPSAKIKIHKPKQANPLLVKLSVPSVSMV